MKKAFAVILIGFVLISITACDIKYKEEKVLNETNLNETTSKNAEIEYKNIRPEEAKNQLENDSDIILLDVRTESEYLEEHIPGSILIPVGDLQEKHSDLLPDKDAKIFVYCRSGRRSVTAANLLIDLGYTEVYNLGGIIDWSYEKESGKNEE